MLRNCYPRKILNIFIEVSLRHIFVTVALCGSCGEIRLLTQQKLQNRAARIVTNNSYDARADILIEKLNWPTISEIIRRETTAMVYKSLNGFVPMYLSDIISRNSTWDQWRIQTFATSANANVRFLITKFIMRNFAKP